MQCWKCNKEVPENSKNCPHCSAPLSRQSVDMMATIGPGGATATQIVPGVLVNDRYDVLREIGRGGMGIVYLAHDRIMEQDVAMKVIPQELCLDPNAVADLKKETAIALKLTHPNIVRLHTLDTWDGQAFVVMEYVDGGTLAHKRSEFGGKCSLDQFLPFLEQLAAALDYSHSSTPAVVHRDLKPLNILLAESGDIKIADFGLARVLRDSASRVSGHDSAGTLAYMAPEQIRGKGVGKKSDLYALAAITYEMLLGNPPFSTGDLRWQIMHEEVEAIEGLPEHVNAALLQALDKDPENRPESAVEFVQQLKGEKQVQHKLKKKAVKKQKPQKSQTAKSAFPFFPVVLVLLLIAGAAGGAYYFKSDAERLMFGGPVLTVESEPAGAMVYLDDAEAGMSPVAVRELSSGAHQVKLVLKKYLAFEKKVFIQPDTPVHINATLTPEPYGDIQVESFPSGADVLIDGKVFGQTPVTLSHLDTGERRLAVQKDGFNIWQQEVEIKPLVLANVKANLTASFGQLTVRSVPAGALIRINGQVTGESPVELNDMTLGEVNVSASKSGYISQSRKAVINAGMRNVVDFALIAEKKTGGLTINPTPESAKIRILNIVPKYQPGMQLEEGSYQIEVSADGYVPERKTVKILSGNDIFISISLKQEKLESISKFASASSMVQASSGSPVYTDPVTGMEFVFVKGGCYQMGDTFGDGDSDEKPVHEVCVDDFYMGKYEVTQGEYRKVTGFNPSRFQKGDNFPVERLSWNYAQSFINILNSGSGRQYRLPTEAEWEYAAREGGKKVRFGTGKNNIGPDEANFDASSVFKRSYSRSGTNRQQTTAVGSFSPNSLGLYDMSGNVSEWCTDWYGKNYYSSSSRNNPQGDNSGRSRVLRGGSWGSYSAYLRATNRSMYEPGYGGSEMGFRLVVDDDLNVSSSLQNSQKHNASNQPGSSKNGWLFVKAKPNDSTIQILNIKSKYSPGMVVQAGKYHIKVFRSGYIPQTQWVTVEEGEYEVVELELEASGTVHSKGPIVEDTPNQSGVKTVTDNLSQLMWVTEDNGGDLSWHEAVKYCKNLNVAGYHNWRIPTGKELTRLFGNETLVKAITLSKYNLQLWVSDNNRNIAERFDVNTKEISKSRKSNSVGFRVLAVRNN